MNSDKLFDFSERVGTKPRSLNIIGRAVSLLVRPTVAWAQISEEKGGLFEVFWPYTWVLMLGPSVILMVICSSLAGILVPLGYEQFALGPGLVTIVLLMALARTIGILVSGKILELVASGAGAKKSWVLSCRLLAYGFTPYYVSVLAGFIPLLGVFLQVTGFIWSIWLFCRGYSIVLGTTKPRPMPVVLEPTR